MKTFVDLFDELDSTTSTLEKVAALRKYLKLADASDSMWMILLLTGKISRRVITAKALRDLFLQVTGYPEWLFEECYSQVGDTAETLSLLLNSLEISAATSVDKNSLTQWLEVEIPALAKIPAQSAERGDRILSWWRSLTAQEIFILNKLMTGGFRVGVSEKIVIRAISEVFEVPSDQIAHRLTGASEPGAEVFAKLISKEKTEMSSSQPYPFCLAHAWSDRKDEGWDPKNWCLEWKYDGIRAQVIKRDQKTWIWSRGEDEITATFPDVVELFSAVPDGTVIDGEILVIHDGQIKSFQDLQKRLGRKKVSAATLKSFPSGFIAYDILEINHEDIRYKPLSERKNILRKVLEPSLSECLRLSGVFAAENLNDLEKLRAASRDEVAEGLMIKAWQSPYVVGRKTGNWWKHKVDPLTLDAVLLYAQAGTGKRANLYTDYTFALWTEDKKLIPFAKAYSGLDQSEIDELDHWIRRHTKEKFGPVRSLEPLQVFEIGFEGILRSSRHKSGIAVRFPRILRWRKDKKVEDADHLETAMNLLQENSL